MDQEAALSAPAPGFLLGCPLPSVVSRTMAPKHVHVLVPRHVAEVILQMGSVGILRREDKPRVRIGDTEVAWLLAQKVEKELLAEAAGRCGQAPLGAGDRLPRGASWRFKLC